jgi:hypothetical protein
MARSGQADAGAQRFNNGGNVLQNVTRRADANILMSSRNSVASGEAAP